MLCMHFQVRERVTKRLLFIFLAYLEEHYNYTHCSCLPGKNNYLFLIKILRVVFLICFFEHRSYVTKNYFVGMINNSFCPDDQQIISILFITV